MTGSIDRIAVIGAGTMGHGIAQVSAEAGYRTVLNDVSEAALTQALEKIHWSLDKRVEKSKITEDDRASALQNLSTEPDLEQAVAGADLVVEAIVENLEIKHELFQRIEGVVSDTAVLSSNTSSLPIAQIAAPLRLPGRVIGMHFFNPVPIMKLLEVVVHPGTTDEVRNRVLEVGQRMHKDPIVVNDSPGFASSRLGVVLALEAMRMVEQGVASAADIDKAMELGYRHPMGPLRVTDLVGLDVRLAIAETLFRELGGETYRPPDILRRKVEAGELGKKTGRGFHVWDS